MSPAFWSGVKPPLVIKEKKNMKKNVKKNKRVKVVLVMHGCNTSNGQRKWQRTVPAWETVEALADMCARLRIDDRTVTKLQSVVGVRVGRYSVREYVV